MIALARIRPGQTIIDVGSGDGRVLFAAAKKGANAIGIEINPYLVRFTQLKALLGAYKGSIRVRWQNLWKADLRDADIIFVYLIPWKMDVLAQKIKKEVPPGSLVISNSFIFPGWKVVRQDTVHHIYAFRV